MGDDGTQSLTDRQSFNVYGSIQPFAQVKNKWISGLTFEAGSWFCNNDTREANGSAVCVERDAMPITCARWHCLMAGMATLVTNRPVPSTAQRRVEIFKDVRDPRAA